MITMGIFEQAKAAAAELIEKAGLKSGDVAVIGCSTSEVIGEHIGTSGTLEIATEIYNGLSSAFSENNIFIAAQCCEHLNRAIVTERAAVPFAETVNVIPQPKAGGSFATTVYKNLENPVAVEFIKADAGLDIGQTLIGMHLKHVAVPVRLREKMLGDAVVTAARTRHKYIGGPRAAYEFEEEVRECP